MTGEPTSRYMEDGGAVLRGESARRAYAALAMAVRTLSPRRNGVPLPADLVRDLGVLRRAAEFGRPAPVGFAAPGGKVSQMVVPAPCAHEDLVDVVEVAAMLEVSVQYARRLCSLDRFESAHLVGREWRVSAAEVRAFDETRRTERSA